VPSLPVQLNRNLRGPCQLRPQTPLLLAVSGGADSIALLHALAQGTSHPARWPLTVAHYNHRLRGAESEADAAFVEEVATRLGLPFRLGQAPASRRLARTGESVEMTARRRRHAFLAETALAVGAGAVVLAHHADDQVELFLLRLFRGAGGSGLGGMLWNSPSPADARVRLCRPLLDLHRVEIRHWLTQRGIGFRDDASNADPGIPRNAIRHQLLPLLREFAGPGLDAALLRTADLVGTDADFIARTAQEWSAAPGDFAGLHPAIQRAILRRQLWDLGQEAPFELVERLRLQPARSVSAARDQVWRQSEGQIAPHPPTDTGEFQPGERSLRLGQRAGDATWGGLQLKWRMVTGPAAATLPSRQAGSESFDAQSVGSNLRLRHWRPGDRFQPLGWSRPAKLQDLFVNRRIPPKERRQRVLAETEDGEICWVEGLPPGEKYRVNPTTRRRLEWGWVRGPQAPA
jgi:tRNA(Ile)-lysidine synthase